LFAIVLGCKLAHAFQPDPGAIPRTARRLFVWALISAGPYYLATGRTVPMNIFLTLALGATACWIAVCDLAGWRRLLAQAAVFAASFVCEYMLPGVLLISGVFAFCRHPNAGRGALILACMMALAFTNWSLWTLLAPALLPLPYLLRFTLPRTKWFFYAFYPAHLLLLGCWDYIPALSGYLTMGAI
jgi:hypothetical protein